MDILFWGSFMFVLYVYCGYPLLLAVSSRLAPKPVKKRYVEPTVSIVIAVHNEKDRIAHKLENCLALDYPKKKLQILVSLDGPTDGSEFVVWDYAPMGVEMVHAKEHHGKASALSRAIRRATGDIIVFADVRQEFDRAAIRELVANFADEDVGAVSGELVLVDPEAVTRRFAPRSGSGRGMSAESRTEMGVYWRYEKAIRSMESAFSSVVGATGAIYAIRRDLYRDLPADTLLDDVVTPMQIVLAGKRVIFEPAAKAYDVVACCPASEFSRKVRTLAGNYQLMVQLPGVLVPWRNPIFIQFVSHKGGRLLVPYALIILFVSNLFLLNGLYAVFFLLQSAWYVLAIIGHLRMKHDAAPPMIAIQESRRAA